MSAPPAAGFECARPAVPPPRKILVVDDDAEILRAIGNILVQQGHDAILCQSGADALARVREETIDLLLVDYRMPELTGIDLLSILQEEERRIPAIVMTGYAATHDRLAFERLRIQAVLKKPILAEHLLRTVETCLPGNGLAAQPSR